MDSALATVALPLALGIIMFGLGLDLTLADFRRVGRHPKAVLVALFCQLVILPLGCFGIVIALDLPWELAVGMMILAASPGGTSANLYSHLFRGDVALNVTLTAINSVIAVITLPIITNIALWYFAPEGDEIGLQFRKVVEVFAIVLTPVALGMAAKARWPEFSQRMDRPVRIASAVILFVLVAAIIVGERDNIVDYLGQVGLAAAAFCALSLIVGFYGPRLVGVTEKQALACSFEIGVHNGTLGIYIAVQILDNETMAISPAVYSVIMFIFAALWGVLITRGSRTADSGAEPGRATS